MLLQIIGFPFALIFFGGIVSLVAVADPHHKRSAPRVGFPLLLAGLFSLFLSWAFAFSLSWLRPQPDAGMPGFLIGYVIGMIGGGLLGYRLALRHKRQMIAPLNHDR
jgi:uncharacterized membrane protein